MNSETPLKVAPRPDVLLDIAREYGSPTFVYFGDVVSDRIGSLRKAFAEWDVRLLYAMKANSNPHVLDLMRREEVGIDAVSPGEGELALKIGFSVDDIFFSGNNMSHADVAWAARRGVCLNVGEESILPRVAELAPGSAISLRANLEVGAGHHAHVVTGGRRSKFGFVLDALHAAIDQARRLGLRIEGLHQHIGSGNLDARPMIASVGRLVEVALSIEGLKFVNIGGGLGIPYRPDEEHANLGALVDGLRPHFDALRVRDIAIWIEPGRYLVAECGVLLVEVTSVKHRGDISFAGTNSGMNHLIRPALYDAYHAIWNLTNPNGPLQTYDVVGNICETGDFFAHERALQEVREGDILAVLDAGAYTMSMASEYNLRPLPAEIFVDVPDRIRLSRRRESPDEIARRHMDLHLNPAV